MESQPSFTELGKRPQGRLAGLGTRGRGNEVLDRLGPCGMARSVVVDPTSGELRRALGPTSWMVLEELLLRSTFTANECVARVSVRALAASLGLAKDTAARAIGRLRDADLVTAAQQRTTVGTFDIGTYLIALPDSITLVASPPIATKRRARVGQRDYSQLSFAIES